MTPGNLQYRRNCKLAQFIVSNLHIIISFIASSDNTLIILMFNIGMPENNYCFNLFNCWWGGFCAIGRSLPVLHIHLLVIVEYLLKLENVSQTSCIFVGAILPRRASISDWSTFTQLKVKSSRRSSELLKINEDDYFKYFFSVK